MCNDTSSPPEPEPAPEPETAAPSLSALAWAREPDSMRDRWDRCCRRIRLTEEPGTYSIFYTQSACERFVYRMDPETKESSKLLRVMFPSRSSASLAQLLQNDPFLVKIVKEFFDVDGLLVQVRFKKEGYETQEERGLFSKEEAEPESAPEPADIIALAAIGGCRDASAPEPAATITDKIAALEAKLQTLQLARWFGTMGHDVIAGSICKLLPNDQHADLVHEEVERMLQRISERLEEEVGNG